MAEATTTAAAAATTTTAAATTAAATTTAAAAPWYTGKLDEAHVGHLQNRGWATKTSEEVAVEATKAHFELNKHFGVPAEQLLRIPKADADEATKRAFWQRLGAPEKATDYDFGELKVGGEVLDDQAFVDTVRNAAFKYNIPKEAAAGLMQDLLKFQGSRETEETGNKTAALAAERDALDKSWGANKNVNLLTAREGAKALGWSEDIVNALEQQVGYAKIMEALRSVGQRIGEHKFVGGGNDPRGEQGVMTREQAQTRKQELMADPAWRQRYQNGGQTSAEYREMTGLNRLVSMPA